MTNAPVPTATALARRPPRAAALALALLLAAGTAAPQATKPAPPSAASPAAPPATPPATPPANAPAAGPVADIDPLERLRQRLTERLAAVKPLDAATPYELHVRVPGTPGTPAARPPAAAPRGTGPRGGGDAGHTGGERARAAWSYEGENGPQRWGGLCNKGRLQSPIDIRGGLAVALEPLQFDYREGGFSVIDTGHTVQVNVAPGSSVDIGGRRYALQQFHFHRPSEERLDGRQFDLSVHLVHRAADGRVAVVAVLVGRGAARPVLDTVFGNLPLEQGVDRPARATLDPSALLPEDRGYYTYMGSLTTPPCDEGVRWVVLRHPVAAALRQIDVFSTLYPNNARPPQQAAGRRILQTP